MSLNVRTIIEKPTSGIWSNAENPDVFVDIFGTTHVTWVGAATGGIKRIFYLFDDGNLNFDSTALTLVGSVNRNSNNPKISVNRSGRALIVFEVENATNNGTDIHFASNDGSSSLSVSVDISQHSGPGILNTSPRLVINDQSKIASFVWLGTHPLTNKRIPYYTRKTLSVYPVSPDLDNDCDNIDIALMGDQNKVFVTFEQFDQSRNKKNVRLSFGDDQGFSLLGQFTDSLNLPILNRISYGNINHLYPKISINPRIADIVDPDSIDDDPSVVVVWEDDDSPNHIHFVQRNESDFSDGTVTTTGVHRPAVNVTRDDLILVAYYKAVGSNNIVNLSFKEMDTNKWTEADDIANGNAGGGGLYNIVILSAGCGDVYISFKTGPTSGPQRIIHLNNFRTKNLFNFEIFVNQLDSASDTRSAVAMHLDDKIGNFILASDAPSRAAVAFTDYTEDFAEPDGIGDVHVFGGVIATKPVIISVSDSDGDNTPEIKFILPGETDKCFFDVYYKTCGASGIVPYQENIMLSGTFAPSGIEGFPEPGYLFTYDGPSGINIPDLYGWGVRQKEGPWSDEFCFRIGDISISHPAIIPSQTSIEKCDTVNLGGSAEPGSIIESQTLIEYSDVDGTIELNRTIISAYTIDAQGEYSGSLVLSLLPNTLSIRTEVIARDSDGNLSNPTDSISNLVAVQNVPPVLVSMQLQAQNTGDSEATNELTVNVITQVTGDVFQIKLWESVSAGGTGEVGAIWRPYSSSMPFTFVNSTNEIKTIFCKLRDACSNESGIGSSSILLDTVGPQVVAVTYDPPTRRLTISFSEPVTSVDPSKIRIVKA